MEFGPPPNAHFTYDMSYFTQPRQRALQTEYTTGTATAVGTAVVGTGTTFTQRMVGCGFRISENGQIPAGEYGINGSINEGIVQSVTDATNLTLQLPIPFDQSTTTPFLIDDPVDVERGAMDEVYCRICEYEFAVLTRSDLRDTYYANMARALQNARAMDVRMSPRTGPYFAPTFDQIAYVNIVGAQR